MPRQSRRDAPGVDHHVIVRGIERAEIFRDSRDRRDLLARLDRILPESGMTCLAWALMPNHVHLLVRTGETPLARVMARVLTGYARFFNERYGRVGYLFQNRYKAEDVEDEVHLRVLVVYVHRNPVSAGIVELGALARHPWTGHAAMLGGAPRAFHDFAAGLDPFGPPSESRASYLQAMKESLEPGARPRDEALDALIAAIGQEEGATPAEILGGSRRPAASVARARIARTACRELGLPQIRVSEVLRISQGAVSRAQRRAPGVSPKSRK